MSEIFSIWLDLIQCKTVENGWIFQLKTRELLIFLILPPAIKGHQQCITVIKAGKMTGEMIYRDITPEYWISDQEE